MDAIEEQREDILDLISELELEATSIFICYALEKLIAILGNIIKSPQEDKFKTLKMDNQVFYSNVGRYSTAIKLLKLLGFISIRLDNNKLAYKYDVPTQKGLHPIIYVAYDELKLTLAKNQSDKISKEEFKVDEFDEQEQDRVNCNYCERKFAKDRIVKHETICSKLKSKPSRNKWDEKKKRLEGTAFENFKQNPDAFNSRFRIYLRRRDISNMQKILDGLKLTIKEYREKAREMKMDNDLYYQCLKCREVLHEKVVKKHTCDDEDEEKDQVEQIKT